MFFGFLKSERRRNRRPATSSKDRYSEDQKAMARRKRAGEGEEERNKIQAKLQQSHSQNKQNPLELHQKPIQNKQSQSNSLEERSSVCQEANGIGMNLASRCFNWAVAKTSVIGLLRSPKVSSFGPKG